MNLVFATNNNHKLHEISDLLGKSFNLVSLSEIGINEDIPEDYPTLEGNALFKAQYIHGITGMDVFADDTGLEIEALDGRPGVHSARFAGPGKNFDSNIDKVLMLLGGKENRRAMFRTVIALILEEKEYLFEGRISGRITSERHGSNGFGYDPIFIPDGSDRSFAEMTVEEKNKYSHRKKAADKLVLFLKEWERKA